MKQRIARRCEILVKRNVVKDVEERQILFVTLRPLAISKQIESYLTHGFTL